jgi:TonB family protein
MIRRTANRIPVVIVLILSSIIFLEQAKGSPKTFAHVDNHYVITAEVAGEHTFVMNIINLSDFVIVIQPNEFIYRGTSGLFYIGQVFESEHKDSRGETQKYSASFLLKGHTFAGMTIVGAFHEQDQIEEMSVRIGAKRFYLQPLEKVDFERLAEKIGDLDLQNANAAAALEQANISAIGTTKSTKGTSEWDRDWQGLISSDGINPPKIIERPEISLTNEARRTRTYGRVKLSCIINRNGGIQDLRIVKGLRQGLDQRALDGVKNSWLFLPATKNGEVVETAISFEVDFPAPEKIK